MLTICGQTGGFGVHIVLDVPKRSPPKSRPRTPKTPRERARRILPPAFFLAEWRESFGYSLREMAYLTGIDAGQIKRLEDRAAGRGDLKNKTAGVGIGVLTAYALALGMQSIEPLRRRPEDQPSPLERFLEAPAEWREDVVRWAPSAPKQ